MIYLYSSYSCCLISLTRPEDSKLQLNICVINHCFGLMQAFAEKYRLPFTLLSDEGNNVRKEWGVPADLFGALPGRQTYVLDKKGVVQLIYNNQFQPEKHIDETLKLLQSL